MSLQLICQEDIIFAKIIKRGKVLFGEMERRESLGPNKKMRMEHDDLNGDLKRLSENVDKILI